MPVQKRITGSTAGEIAASVERGVAGGAFRPGELLPPVRQLAAALGVSPATAAAAYRLLRHRGLATGDRRRGTTLRDGAAPASRPLSVLAASAYARDLESGNPDPALLPPLAPALRALEAQPRLYGASGAHPDLVAFAASEFAADGVDARHVTVTGGGLDAIDRVLREHLRAGDRVGLEDPSLPAIRDLLESAGYGVEPVAVDDEGPLPDAMAAALRRRASAVVISPRAQNPTGATITPGRAADLRRVLAKHGDVLLVENDAAGPVSGAPFVPLAAAARARWAVVRSTSKWLGPDLRTAVVAGDAATIARVERRQALGVRWVSHLLQQLVLHLWSDPAAGRWLARASDVYGRRRRALLAALAAHGIAARGTAGFHVWIPLAEEAPVVRALAGRGWLVAPGERFRLSSPPGIRVTTAALDDAEALRLAADIAGVLEPVAAALA